MARTSRGISGAPSRMSVDSQLQINCLCQSCFRLWKVVWARCRHRHVGFTIPWSFYPVLSSRCRECDHVSKARLPFCSYLMRPTCIYVFFFFTSVYMVFSINEWTTACPVIFVSNIFITAFPGSSSSAPRRLSANHVSGRLQTNCGICYNLLVNNQTTTSFHVFFYFCLHTGTSVDVDIELKKFVMVTYKC